MSGPKNVDDSEFRQPGFIAKIREGDASAIEQLVRAYTSHLYNAATGMGFTSGDCEEIVQRTWVKFFEIAADFEGRSHVRTFLFGILYKKALEKRRDRAFMQLDEQVESMLDKRFDARGRWMIAPIEPEKFMLGAETSVILEKCLEGLPENQRMAFVLKEVEEIGSGEICDVLGIGSSNLGVLLFRARNRLRECVEKRYATEMEPQP